jgi:glutamine synthetase type III
LQERKRGGEKEKNMKRIKAIIMVTLAVLAGGQFLSQAPKVYAETTGAAQSAEEQAKLAEMKTTIDILQTAIAELNAKVQTKQAVAQPKAMTLPEIAVQIQRIAKEEEILAQKVQAYVAMNPRSTTVAISTSVPASTGATDTDANAKIAQIRKEIADLSDKLMAQKATGTTGAAETPAKTETAAEIPAEVLEKPAETAVVETAKPAEGTPEITINPQGEVVQNGEKQSITVSTESSKKGLFQSIADYFKTLFKF